MKILISIVLMWSSMCLSDTKDVFHVSAENGAWTGTAVSVLMQSGKIYTLTNKHVCGDQKSLIILNEDSPVRIAVVKVSSNKTDLCALTSVSKTGYKLAELYGSKDPTTVIGYPNNIYKSVTGTLDNYIFTTSRDKHPVTGLFESFIGHVEPGSSGSPGFNGNNEIIGLVSLVANGGKSGCLVPLEFIRDFLDSI